MNDLKIIAPNDHETQFLFTRFDLFKGIADEAGKISKIRSVGSAYVRQGHQTYTLILKTFLEDRFYLLPNVKGQYKGDYIILTREASFNAKRKYFWNSVGEAFILDGINHGVMKLSWDLLADDIYMSLHPIAEGKTSDHDRNQLEAA